MKMNILIRNNVILKGSGARPLLFAHGFGCDQNMWRYVAAAFEDDYRIILFDYVGSGLSDSSTYDPERYSKLEGYAQDVIEVIDALDLHDVVFVGHSVSSVVGMLASLARPDRFSQLILVCPSACFVNDPPDYMGGFERADIESLLDLMDKNHFGWADYLAPVIMSAPDQPEIVDELRDSLRSIDPFIARRFAEATFYVDVREDLPNVTVPALVLQCQEDNIAPTSVGQYVARRLPRSTFVQMEATGHCPPVSHPDETVRHIREYLSTATVPGASP